MLSSAIAFNMTELFPQYPDTPVMLVTGAAKRIGAAVICAAHNQGYRVIIHCNQSEKEALILAKNLNAKRTDSTAVIKADLELVNDSQQLHEFTQSVICTFGRVDVLVHNASRFYPTPISDINLQHWDELMLTNAKAPLMLSQALRGKIAKTNGCIISLLDIHGLQQPFLGYTVYNMAKAAHSMMVKSLALELAPNIRVNGIAPGANILPDDDSDQALSEVQKQQIIRSIPMQRLGAPNDIADCVLYLAKASYITGEIITIDGGRSLTIAGGLV